LNLRHTGLCVPGLFCVLDRLGDPTAEVAEVYSVSVTMKMVARKLYQAELPPVHPTDCKQSKLLIYSFLSFNDARLQYVW